MPVRNLLESMESGTDHWKHHLAAVPASQSDRGYSKWRRLPRKRPVTDALKYSLGLLFEDRLAEVDETVAIADCEHGFGEEGIADDSRNLHTCVATESRQIKLLTGFSSTSF